MANHADLVSAATPLLWWRYGETSGADIANSGSSSTALDGGAVGAFTRAAPSLLANEPSGKSFAVSGNGLARSAGGVAVLNALSAWTAITWMRLTSLAGNPSFMSHDRDGSIGQLRWRAYINTSTKKLCVVYLTGSNSYEVVNGTGPDLAVNTLYHVAISWVIGGNMTFYVNGAQYGTPQAAPSMAAPADGPFQIGANYGGSISSATSGSYSNSQFYNYAIGPTLIQQMYDAGLSLPVASSKIRVGSGTATKAYLGTTPIDKIYLGTTRLL